MKLLVLANLDTGLYQFRRELLGRLLEEHEVTLSLPDGDLVRPLEEMGCAFIHTPVERRGKNPGKDFRLFLRYLALLRREKPGLVITYTIKPNIYGGLACRLMGVPYAANITGLGTAFQKNGVLKRLVTTLYRGALNGANAVLFENAENRQTLVDEGVVREKQCVLLPGAGVNLDVFSPAPYPEDGPVRFLFMGRVMAEKGVDELFSAMAALRRSGIDCTLDVLGFCEEHYEEAIRAGEAEGWLRYHGYQRDVTPFIAAAHCFVLPSWHEGMANTNLECAAMARPVITSRIHGCMEAVDEGRSGLLCEAKDVDSLRSSMETFCRLSQAEREAMGLAGRERMERLFSRQAVVDKTLEALGLGVPQLNFQVWSELMQDIRLSPAERFMRSVMQRYDHEKYWRYRAIVVDPARGSKPGDLFRLWYIKRADAFNNASMGTHLNSGARFETPPQLPHGLNGIIVTHRAVIGAHCRIYQQVTIGETAKGAPVIGDHVVIGAGARLIGPITVGDNARIGAGCAVMEDIPAGATVRPGPLNIVTRGKGHE